VKDLIQRLRSDNYMEDEVRSFAREAADALERLTAGSVKTPEQYYHVVQVYDGSINHIPYVKPEDAIDYGNRKDAAGYLRGVAAERERCALIAATPISGEQDDITMAAKDRVAAEIRKGAAMSTQELRKLAESYMPTFVGTVLHNLLDKIDQLQAELGDLPEAQNDMLKEIKQLKEKLAALEKQEPYGFVDSRHDLANFDGTIYKRGGFDFATPLYLSAGAKE